MNTNISVIIPTFKRSQQLLQALEKIHSCSPRPAEILVHIDCGDEETEAILKKADKEVLILKSNSIQGPGGSRNQLIQQAQYNYIACFDDDSWPLDKDYFSVAQQLLEEHPAVAVIASMVFHRSEAIEPASENVYEASSFQNCACMLRKEAFFNTAGYLSLRYAYGMEEADLALQLQDSGWRLLATSKLRVYHDSDLSHHASAEINSWHITNTALLAYLRYPKRFWGVGALKVMNRVRYALSVGRYRGILSGIARIPLVLCQYRSYRKPVRVATYLAHQRIGRIV